MKRWTRWAATGFLSAATLFIVCCAVHLPALRDPTRTFGPDAELWKAFVQSAVLPPLFVSGMIGAGLAAGGGSLRDRRRQRIVNENAGKGNDAVKDTYPL